jgi:hypothetical protein
MRAGKNALALSMLIVAALPAKALEDAGIERLATCQDSWVAWKNEPAKLEALSLGIRAAYERQQGQPFLVPKTPQTVIGLPVAQLFPDSVGMGVGFSVLVDVNFDKAKKALEQKTGKLLNKCETGDGMLSCELKLGEQKTLLVMAQQGGKGKTTLFGCYYFYEK